MNESIGLAVNFYNEPNALPGMLEHATKFFDDILFVSAPPRGKKQDEESISIIEKWGCRIVHSTISDGFGVLRTRCIHESSTEWVMLMDCDERFFPVLPIYDCHGTGKYPEDEVPNLSVGIGEPAFNQGDLLRKLIRDNPKANAIRTCRRHWFDPGMHKPCQNWTIEHDWQLRIMRNKPYIGYRPERKMHELAVDTRINRDPLHATGDTRHGPFHDHFHLWFKKMEPEQRKEDIEIYDALDKSEKHLK